MAEKEEIVTKEENKAAEQPTVEKKKGNKTIMMMGIVVLISVGCAFVFVSKVYPSLTGNVASDALVPENPENEAAVETAEVQTVKQPETKKEPASSSKKKEEKGKEGKEGANKEESMIVPVETLIVNLSGSNGRRYLKAKINLEAKDGDVKKVIEAKSIQIKDRLISIISSKTLEDIDGLEAQENLRKEIKDAVDVVLKVEGVLQVYFTEFVVQ
ncbi:MAG: flagellar basal body-associated FliL family protein [Planctomycetes bacterium]|uniref:flagellar basal body-associated FliL family protein n=1 Tax=Candidatus Wunengus sp. YC65 TaxID=3367701 RepID=UPI001D6B2341|nr:flagellar basal body-associated FliL family protein [Planctomycetota bacterium]MBI5796744.1 flagellar basal body-associated FliL family protein [Planctomycetota bacterium]